MPASFSPRSSCLCVRFSKRRRYPIPSPGNELRAQRLDLVYRVRHGVHFVVERGLTRVCAWTSLSEPAVCGSFRTVSFCVNLSHHSKRDRVGSRKGQHRKRAMAGGLRQPSGPNGTSGANNGAVLRRICVLRSERKSHHTRLMPA